MPACQNYDICGNMAAVENGLCPTCAPRQPHWCGPSQTGPITVSYPPHAEVKRAPAGPPGETKLVPAGPPGETKLVRASAPATVTFPVVLAGYHKNRVEAKDV